ncbi:MAG: hypothetical protein OXH39_19870 [Candidatus Poribacteria bacterium]|nr:hypothetical protein [Candidatus Poribacteria bacterium]
MKRIFHWGETLARLPFFATLGFAILLWGGTYAYTQGSETGSSNTHVKSESIEFTPTVSSNYKRYTGPQNAQELMKALDADYNKGLSKKLPETIPETKVIISNGSLVIRNGEILERPKATTYSSDLTISEIDARYPRAEWLQLLLDKGITIDNSDEYASLLSKRYLLILLEDNPDLYEAGFRGIPPTDDWETYKAAYINKLVSKHTGKQIERSREQIKLALKRSKESIVRAMTQLEHKALKSQQLEHVRKQLEHVRKQIARAQEALERSEEPMHPQEPLPPDEPN